MRSEGKSLNGNLFRMILVVILFLSGIQMLKADEGMWIPMLIERYQIDQMQEAGLKLSAEEIYSINQDCLKDAIVIFGGGCTGEMISNQGLLLTNHHCGEGVVQSHSSVEQDYLSNGFWAMNRDQELPGLGLSVTFLRYMEDVTSEITHGFTQGMDPQDRERMVSVNMGKVIQKATSGTNLDAVVKPFYYGNEYFLFVYEVFRDVRLVGAPPVSIGNFGRDRDNWMWPRHTGDFSIFRVYAGQENQPAGYDPLNKPYKPRKYLEIDATGIEDDDFTMILGYPGSTSRYLHSEGVRLMLEKSLPLKIELRTLRMEIMDRYMKSSDLIRIQYTSKYRRLSNSWKKWQGIILGLNRMDAVTVKVETEHAFQQWVNEDGERQLKYDQLLDQFAHHYQDIAQYTIAVDLMREAIEPIELFREVSSLVRMMRQGRDGESIRDQVELFYKNYHHPIDRETFAVMMEAYQAYLSDSFIPSFFGEIQKKHKGSFEAFANRTYSKTIFSRKGEVLKMVDTYEKDAEQALKKLMKDPTYIYLNQFREIFLVGVNPVYHQLQKEIDKTYNTYMRAMLEWSGDRLLYPDANFTMRITFGKVDGYKPLDGIQYQSMTKLAGIIEKGKEEFEDYRVPQKLRKLYETKDYGPYGVNGTMPVCFIASNHTSGGNSGSPVLNGEGRLIGINFDRNWEGTMSDIYYDPSLCRNIAVDIRYVLFIIDKYADADYLLDEMKIIL